MTSFYWKRRLCCVAGVCFAFGSLSQAATIPVFNTADALAGSLRQAIQDAAPGDSIGFQIPTSDPGYSADTGIYTIGLTSGPLVIAKDLTIDGGGQKIRVTRAGASQSIINLNAAVTVSLLGLTISNGNNSAVQSFSGGTLIATGCTFFGNTSPASGGAITTISPATLRVSNCTFTGNSATTFGSAISSGGMLFLDNSTISGNDGQALSGNPGAAVHNAAGGTARVRNTIIAGNTSPAQSKDVNGVFVSEGYNLIGTPIGSSGFGATGDQIGVSVFQVGLGPLQDNGGPTQTMRPLPGSVAIDQGNRGVDANNQPINIDQRGYVRPIDLPGIPNAIGGDGSDIGAVEVGPMQAGPTFTVTNTGDHNESEGCTTDDCTLAEAISAANANADLNTILFQAGVSGTIRTINPVGLISGFQINNPVVIQGPGARFLRVKRGFQGRVFTNSSTNVTLAGLTISGGEVNDANGGAIHNSGGLTLNDCTITSSFAFGTQDNGDGGGLYNAAGATATLTGCTINGNSAGQYGGGVYTDGIFTATNCTFVGNTAQLRGGGILSRFAGGASMVTLRNCTISANLANDGVSMAGFGGGGVFCEGGAAQHFIGNTIIAGNFAVNDPDLRGNHTSAGHNLIGKVGDSTGFSNGVNGDLVGTSGSPVVAQFGPFGNNGGPTNTYPLLGNSPAINNGDDALAPPTDQRGYGRSGVSDMGAFEFDGIRPLPSTLGNISTRLRVETNDNLLIGGFIITGTQPKRVILRAIGPSLPVAGALADPFLELRDASGSLLLSNDNWRTGGQEPEIIATGIPPGNDLESAIVATLPANSSAYTAIVRGVNNGTGVGLVEAYDLDPAADSKLANISTRGFVQTDDNVLIGGLIVLGQDPLRVILRTIGPSLPVPGALGDPKLELRDGNGALIRANDNWRSEQEAEIIATGIPPANDLESAIVEILPGSGAAYTAIVRGADNATGVALVEVYALP